jgi:hypothetical protein
MPDIALSCADQGDHHVLAVSGRIPPPHSEKRSPRKAPMLRSTKAADCGFRMRHDH